MPDAIAEWTALLDRFEADLNASTASTSLWQPAATPLPDALADRARQLAERQRDAIARIAHEKAQVQQHLNALKRLPPVRGDAAVYLDVDG
ncbi:hypothetical protein [Paramicrobacterium agarici]|uniref:hypothetical protein n=1 Tax=Paramicrobacterium agarici TaxID=630514 RepID=UPI001152CEDE|nr:hypothetical protein [Microbacterium agarici]TQO23631.1 hypothetical protein FB385_2488 [Microbacterium agarici]